MLHRIIIDCAEIKYAVSHLVLCFLWIHQRCMQIKQKNTQLVDVLRLNPFLKLLTTKRITKTFKALSFNNTYSNRTKKHKNVHHYHYNYRAEHTKYIMLSFVTYFPSVCVCGFWM